MGLSQRRDEVRTALTTNRLHAKSLQLSPRTLGVQPTRGIGTIEAGVKFAMVVLSGFALHQATNLAAVHVAMANIDHIVYQNYST